MHRLEHRQPLSLYVEVAHHLAPVSVLNARSCSGGSGYSRPSCSGKHRTSAATATRTTVSAGGAQGAVPPCLPTQVRWRCLGLAQQPAPTRCLLLTRQWVTLASLETQTLAQPHRLPTHCVATWAKQLHSSYDRGARKDAPSVPAYCWRSPHRRALLMSSASYQAARVPAQPVAANNLLAPESGNKAMCPRMPMSVNATSCQGPQRPNVGGSWKYHACHDGARVPSVCSEH